jgi:putative hydrolase of the HAD superfamily
MNIVFDLGGVVFRWQPETIIRHFFHDSKEQDRVRSEIFSHVDWIELDRGTIETEQAITRGAAVPQFLTPMEETLDLIRVIRRSNHKLFVLSNMHPASISYLEKTHDIWGLFDGVVISSRIQMVKPEIPIYEHLLATYSLTPAETVFIDDLSENLTAASTLGIQTIRFVDADQCKQDLTNLGCI